MRFTLKAAFLAGGLALGCSVGPDELELGYGRILAGDSSIEGWPMTNEDSDLVTVGLVWRLQPTRVEVINPVVSMVPRTVEQDPDTSGHGTDMERTPSGQSPDTQDASAAALEEIAQEAGEIADTLEAFDAFGIVTKIGFFLLAGLVLWIYRERLGRLIPGGHGKKKD